MSVANVLVLKVREWLDEVRPGFGGRFAAPFESRGIDDVCDLPVTPMPLIQQV